MNSSKAYQPLKTLMRSSGYKVHTQRKTMGKTLYMEKGYVLFPRTSSDCVQKERNRLNDITLLLWK